MTKTIPVPNAHHNVSPRADVTGVVDGVVTVVIIVVEVVVGMPVVVLVMDG